jgi:hypothetical protein
MSVLQAAELGALPAVDAFAIRLNNELVLTARTVVESADSSFSSTRVPTGMCSSFAVVKVRFVFGSS